LTVYDLLGQKVREQIYSQGEAGGQVGLNRISWDGRNDDGVAVGNGGYVVVLDIAAEGRTMKRKIAVIK
jgi:flagellar hook assembly protein FlgD